MVRPAAIVMWVCALASSLVSIQAQDHQTKTIAERLGYPTDSKLLIIHADDLAVAHSVDEASFSALESGAVTSASVMVPCPWLTEVAAWAGVACRCRRRSALDSHERVEDVSLGSGCAA